MRLINPLDAVIFMGMPLGSIVPMAFNRIALRLAVQTITGIVDDNQARRFIHTVKNSNALLQSVPFGHQNMTGARGGSCIVVDLDTFAAFVLAASNAHRAFATLAESNLDWFVEHAQRVRVTTHCKRRRATLNGWLVCPSSLHSGKRRAMTPPN